MQTKTPYLQKYHNLFISSKDKIKSEWKMFNPNNKDDFASYYIDDTFEYYMGLISGSVKLGDCPVRSNFLYILKEKNVKVEQLFDMCNHYRKVVIEFVYDSDIYSKEILEEVSYLFDENFKAILQYFTNTISEKEQEISYNVKLLNEYKYALDESALISKTDTDGNITYVNDKLCQLCGYSKEELIGKKHSIMKHKDMSSQYFKNLWLELKKNGIFKGIIKNTKKNTESFYIDVTIVKINNSLGDLSEYMSIAYDITILVNTRLEALKAGKAKEYFLSNMSHEIRTPLNAILGFVNLLIDDNVSKKHRKYLDIINSSGKNLLNIINDILDFSKLRAGEFTICPKIVSIHDEISYTMELFVASANSKNITITSFIDPNIPNELYVDPLRIHQIVSNFLSNAIKFSSYGGIINVEVTFENKILIIQVKDNGIGISKEDLGDIFTAFVQAQHSHMKKSEGTGLGLSICQQLAEHMNGSVSANSVLGMGSTFCLKVPIETNTEASSILEDMQEFKNLEIVIYSQDKEKLYKNEDFLKYSKIFGMNTKIVNYLDNDFDIAVLIYEEITESLREQIKNSDKKYIVLMNKLYNDFEDFLNVVPLCFPLYPSKIKSSFYELLHPQVNRVHKNKFITKFKGHILIAEDNEANKELIKILLAKYGLTFDLANNGLEALNLYKANKYDLILMDEQMPVMNGIETLREILDYEKENNLSHTPVSAITANVIKGSLENSLDNGYDSFLGKPIILKEFENIFKKYLIIADNDLIEIKKEIKTNIIEGLDVENLIEELQLSESELIMLISLYIKKMNKLMPMLNKAINNKEYSTISKLAHNIKGSSGNFRIELIQNYSDEMESMSKQKNTTYHYMDTYEKIINRINKIKIV